MILAGQTFGDDRRQRHRRRRHRRRQRDRERDAHQRQRRSADHGRPDDGGPAGHGHHHRQRQRHRLDRGHRCRAPARPRPTTACSPCRRRPARSAPIGGLTVNYTVGGSRHAGHRLHGPHRQRGDPGRATLGDHRRQRHRRRQHRRGQRDRQRDAHQAPAIPSRSPSTAPAATVTISDNDSHHRLHHGDRCRAPARRPPTTACSPCRCRPARSLPPADSPSTTPSAAAATPTTDYTALTGSVVIPAGSLSATIDVSGIVDDNIVEGNETVERDAHQHQRRSRSQVTVDGNRPPRSPSATTTPPPSPSPPPMPRASETATDNGLFTVSLSAGKVAPTGGLTVNYTVAGSRHAGHRLRGPHRQRGDPGRATLGDHRRQRHRRRRTSSKATRRSA